MTSEQGGRVPEEYTDSAEQPAAAGEAAPPAGSHPQAVNGEPAPMPPTEGSSPPTARRQMAHGGAGEWLARNFAAPVGTSLAHEPQVLRQGRRAVTADDEAEEGNLVQLPDGATFGTEHRPSPKEREQLLRYAASAQHEMQVEARDQRRQPDGADDTGD